MKCPRCNSTNTHLSWLREFIVVYWCDACHSGFDVDRHQIRSAIGYHLQQKPSENGHQEVAQSVA